MSHTDRLIYALALVRLGQELGTDSPLARAVTEAIVSILGAVAGR